MNDRWFYSHAGSKIGPCSSRQLRELAFKGLILQTDTIWKEGIEKGVAASKVKNLFTPAQIYQASEPVPETSLTPSAAGDIAALVKSALTKSATDLLSQTTVSLDVPQSVSVDSTALTPVKPAVEETAAPKPVASGNWQSPKRKGKAIAGKGAVLVGQDGINVKYRKKCTTCGTSDSSWATMPIRNGVMRVGYFCPKCRKHREVEVHGSFY